MTILAWAALVGVGLLFGVYAWALSVARGDTRKPPPVVTPDEKDVG